MEVLQKSDLDPACFSNANTVGAGAVVLRTDVGSRLEQFVSAAIMSAAKPISLVHAYTGTDGAGTLTLTWADGDTLTCALGPLPIPCP